MPLEFDINLTEKDIFRFNMYHTYTGFHGIASILLAIGSFACAVKTFGTVSTGYTILYFVFGIILLIYMPLSLYTNSKRQVMMSEAFQHALHFSINEQGITITQGEEKAELAWNQIYKVVETKSNILIYSTRKHAFVLPQEMIKKEHDALIDCMKEHVEKFRLKIKKQSEKQL